MKEVTFVGDRGIITQTSAEKLKEVKGLHTISALTHRQIVDLVERKLVKADLFDEKRIAEVIDPDKPELRYCLCRNPQSGTRETATRQRLLDRTREALDKIVGRKTQRTGGRGMDAPDHPASGQFPSRLPDREPTTGSWRPD